MATKTYKCTNYAECDAALSKTPVEVEEGEDLVCPSCSKATLEPEGGAKKGGGKNSGGVGSKKLLMMAGAAVLLLVVAWAFWPHSPNPDLANAMLTDYFPQLTR